eukprot:tig00021073_g18009.t1
MSAFKAPTAAGGADELEDASLERIDLKLEKLAQIVDRASNPLQDASTLSTARRPPSRSSTMSIPPAAAASEWTSAARAPAFRARPRTASWSSGAGPARADLRLPLSSSFSYGPNFERREQQPPEEPPPGAGTDPEGASPSSRSPASGASGEHAPPVEEREKAFVRDFSAIRDKMRQSKVWKFEGHTTLESGEPVVGHLEESELKFYRFDMPRGATRVVVRLFALSGNPDLYASYQHEMPNLTQHQFASANEGDDEITISDGDAGWRPDPLFVSVRGQTRCEYRLAVHASTSALLAPHKEVAGRCLPGMPAYYRFLVAEPRMAAHIQLHQRAELEGGPQLALYVSTSAKYPSPEESEWRALDAARDGGLLIDPAHPAFRAGWLYVAVDAAGAGPAAAFRISAGQRKLPGPLLDKGVIHGIATAVAGGFFARHRSPHRRTEKGSARRPPPGGCRRCGACPRARAPLRPGPDLAPRGARAGALRPGSASATSPRLPPSASLRAAPAAAPDAGPTTRTPAGVPRDEAAPARQPFAVPTPRTHASPRALVAAVRYASASFASPRPATSAGAGAGAPRLPGAAAHAAAPPAPARGGIRSRSFGEAHAMWGPAPPGARGTGPRYSLPGGGASAGAHLATLLEHRAPAYT